MADVARALEAGPGEGKTIQGPAGGPLTFKARGEQTAGSLTAFENTIAPGDGPPLHTHAAEDEAWCFFDRFAELPDDADIRAAFRTLGAEVGMDVLGPPLARSHPLRDAP